MDKPRHPQVVRTWKVERTKRRLAKAAKPRANPQAFRKQPKNWQPGS
jgi:hypothetical protein